MAVHDRPITNSTSMIIPTSGMIGTNQKENKESPYTLPDVNRTTTPTKVDLTAVDSMASSSSSSTDSCIDPWAMPELQDTSESWSDLSASKKRYRVLFVLLKLVALIVLLYFFFCSLDFLSSAFRLLGGKTAGEFFRNSEHLKNPIVGLMLGILATVLMQSSSTSTSIVVTMVASNFLDVPTAIPIIMGANIGTSVTNTLVSLAQSNDRSEFRRAFAGATVHDMFNWLTVMVLLPLESATGYLYRLTSAIVDSYEWKQNKGANKEMLTLLTRPFTDKIIQLDKNVINGMASGDATVYNRSLIKEWCRYPSEVKKNVSVEWLVNGGGIESSNFNEQVDIDGEQDAERCVFLLNNLGLGDSLVGLILLGISLILLCTCLILMVKVLHSMLRGQMANVIKHTLNADFPGRLGFLTGYAAILVGCGMTILVQSSSIFTSALTPLVGLGVISVERVYPLTLGSNLGTTTTGILASLAASGAELKHSIQIALCHLFFNVSGILIFYPIPFTRFPISLAKKLGNTTAKYRWFSIVYLISMFFMLPAIVFGLSIAGSNILLFVGCPIIAVLLIIFLLNVMQRKCPSFLPSHLRTWEGLPEWMHSLKPVDRIITSVHSVFVNKCGCCDCQQDDLDQTNDHTSYMYDKKPPLRQTQSQTAILPASSLRTVPSGNRLSSAIRAAPSCGDLGIDNPMMSNVITRV